MFLLGVRRTRLFFSSSGNNLPNREKKCRTGNQKGENHPFHQSGFSLPKSIPETRKVNVSGPRCASWGVQEGPCLWQRSTSTTGSRLTALCFAVAWLVLGFRDLLVCDTVERHRLERRRGRRQQAYAPPKPRLLQQKEATGHEPREPAQGQPPRLASDRTHGCPVAEGVRTAFYHVASVKMCFFFFYSFICLMRCVSVVVGACGAPSGSVIAARAPRCRVVREGDRVDAPRTP